MRLTIAIACSLLLAACQGRPAPERTPDALPATTTDGTETPDDGSPSVPFAPTADCEDATVGGATATVRLEDNFFDPACVVVLGGQALRLVNRGANLHNLSIEETEVAVDVAPGTTQTTEAVGEVVEPGTYTYFCEYHRELGMEGDITVTAVG